MRSIISVERLEGRENPGHWAVPVLLPSDHVAGLYWMPGDGPGAAVVLHTTRTDLVAETVKDIAPFNQEILVVADPRPAAPQLHVYDIVFDVKLPIQYVGFSGSWDGTPAEIRNDLSTEYTGVVIAHEIGHGLGLQHTTELNNVMYAAPTQANWDSWQITAGQEFLVGV